MKRRDFLKTLSAISLVGVAVGKSVPNPDKPLATIDENWCSILSVRFCGRQIKVIKSGNEREKIIWSSIGEYDKYDKYDWIRLGTDNTCQALVPSRDCLYWIGRYEVWQLEYTGDPDLPFRVSYCGELANIGNRMGYRQFRID